MKYEQNDLFFLSKVKDGSLIVTREGVITNTATGNVVGQKTPFIVLKDGDKSCGIAAYRLVWLAFNGLIPDKKIVFRKDVKAGIGLDNLEIKTRAQYNRDVGTGSRFKVENLKGSNNYQSKFTDEDVVRHRTDYLREPYSIRKRSKEVGVSFIVFLNMLKGKRYVDLPYAVTEISKKFSGSRKGTTRLSSPNIKKSKVETIKPKAVKPVVQKPVKSVKPPVINKPTKPTTDWAIEEKNKRLEMLRRISEKRKREGHDF